MWYTTFKALNMSRNRDTSFPSGSIGRTGPPPLEHVSSRESMNAHPLLTSSPPPHGQSVNSDNTHTRYVPYTPRHRPPTSSVSPGTTTQLSVPAASQPQTGATSRLQLQNLKAAVQTIGLGTGTLGWAILEKLVDSDATPEWDDIWVILLNAKVSLNFCFLL